MNNTEFVNIARLLTTFNFEIEELPDNLKCAKCKLVLKDACRVPCGCIFCQVCINDMIASGGEFCPGVSEDCRQTFLSLFSLDNTVNEMVSRLTGKCAYKGCVHECQLANVEEHLRECPRKSEDNCRQSEILIGMVANINMLKLRNAESMKEYEMIKKNNENSKHAIERLNKKDEGNMKEIEMLKERDKALMREVDMLKERDKDKIREIDMLKKRDEDKMRQIDMLREIYVYQLNEIDMLRLKDENKTKEIDMLKELYKNSMREIEKLNKVNENNSEQIDILKPINTTNGEEIGLKLKEIDECDDLPDYFTG